MRRLLAAGFISVAAKTNTFSRLWVTPSGLHLVEEPMNRSSSYSWRWYLPVLGEDRLSSCSLCMRCSSTCSTLWAPSSPSICATFPGVALKLIPPRILAWSAHCHHDDVLNSKTPSLHGWWSFGLSTSHPRAQCSHFVPHSSWVSPQVLMTVVSSPACYALSKLSERPLALVVGSLLGPVWNDAWKTSVILRWLPRGTGRSCHRIPLTADHVLRLLHHWRGCCIGSDKRGWDRDDENRLVLNCCKRAVCDLRR